LQISRDHSELQDLLDRGVLDKEEAKVWPRRNVVTRALGATDEAALEIVDGPVVAGDRFLLCTDGLTNHVEDAEIAALLAADDPQKSCDDLVALTLVRGAKDNVTAVLVVCDADERTIRSERHWSRASFGRSAGSGAADS
jgi:protein phosphatase